MSQGKRKRSALELGHDAFLDIVANLVGILIILVVVLLPREQPCIASGSFAVRTRTSLHGWKPIRQRNAAAECNQRKLLPGN